MNRLLERTAGAPISWGVCEVPGWGVQLPADRVLSEMRSVGLSATELGPVGYLPTDSSELRRCLEAHGLSLTGGFNALALADPDAGDAVLALTAESAALLAAAGASTFVSCAVSAPSDWRRCALSDDQWSHMLTMLDRVDEVCDERGLTHVFHPHVDSLVETASEIQRLLDDTGRPFVLDTGHMQIGGFDPLRFAELHADRVGLVHLKDVRLEVADRLNSHELTLMEAVQAGLFPPLGEGDVPVGEIVSVLDRAGYQGWYVIEQDVALTDGEPPMGEGPIRGVQTSVAYLRSLDVGPHSDENQDGTSA